MASSIRQWKGLGNLESEIAHQDPAVFLRYQLPEQHHVSPSTVSDEPREALGGSKQKKHKEQVINIQTL